MQHPKTAAANTQQNSTMRANSISLSQNTLKNTSTGGTKSVPTNGAGYVEQHQNSLREPSQVSKNMVNQQINNINHQRLLSMDLDVKDGQGEGYAAHPQQQAAFIMHHNSQLNSQKNRKQAQKHAQQQSMHVKKLSGVPEAFQASHSEAIQYKKISSHQQSKSLMGNINLVSSSNVVSQSIDLEKNNLVGTDNTNSNAALPSRGGHFPNSVEQSISRSQTRGDSGTMKRNF